MLTEEFIVYWAVLSLSVADPVNVVLNSHWLVQQLYTHSSSDHDLSRLSHLTDQWEFNTNNVLAPTVSFPHSLAG